MAYEHLQVCLNQKIILLTKILNITKQIEVQSRQNNIVLENLPEQRQIYIDRLKKCNRMVSDIAEKSPVLKKIFSGDFSNAGLGAEESAIIESEKKCRTILHAILSTDVEARRMIQAECDRLQEKLHAVRHVPKDRAPHA